MKTTSTTTLRNPELGLEEVVSMMNTIFINYSKRRSSVVPERSQESYRKSRDNSGCEATINCQESAMATAITCHNCKRSGCEIIEDCKQLMKNSDRSSNLDNGTRK